MRRWCHTRPDTKSTCNIMHTCFQARASSAMNLSTDVLPDRFREVRMTCSMRAWGAHLGAVGALQLHGVSIDQPSHPVLAQLHHHRFRPHLAPQRAYRRHARYSWAHQVHGRRGRRGGGGMGSGFRRSGFMQLLRCGTTQDLLAAWIE